MIKLERIPETNIVIITAKGKVTDDDYEDVIVTAVEETLQQYDK